MPKWSQPRTSDEPIAAVGINILLNNICKTKHDPSAASQSAAAKKMKPSIVENRLFLPYFHIYLSRFFLM